ncbi:MAG: T9SS type A sorting domain-containing protein [Sediminibacterium sp. Gen4]|uniref:T9SS type A sorting domain-containing protein n=1 Tax=unclassified Sediminibacterium TaxID=2635961 RepID=UPI0015B99A9F|nr:MULTISPECIES: T9SS type A sorting domain-containing protein [unclassified Sediminibacterium]MBW0161126.1 T9SS type A sorting domain-containing protein [Sediminibacterium sp.]MBW0164762.1 T9SS type A sorting domain-containing protein [Sediminibacterium sp.]NWK65621.1 T9SS type A sorting domain-containing protein [Sediminibacterium sp. Gen4]
MKNIFTLRWLFVTLFCCIGYWGQSQGVVTTDWATIGARNANGDFQIIAIGKSDTIYALSSYNSVYKITPAGAVTTNWLTSSDISSGSSVDMTAISVNKTTGDVYLLYTESGNYRIAKITPGKTIAKSWSTLATTGSVSLGYKFIRVDATGDIYLLKNNASIDKIASTGGNPTNLITLDKTSAYAGADASGNMFLLCDDGSISKVTSSGVETTNWATFSNSLVEIPPVTDGSGNVYMLETDGSTNNLLRFSSSGGTQDRSTSVGDVNIRSMSIDASANIYMLNDFNKKIIRVTSAGVLNSSFASLPIDNYTSTRGAMVVDGSNSVFVLNTGESGDGGSDLISKITSAGVVTDKWADMAVPHPMGITRDNSGNLFVANTKNNTVSKITSAGSVTAAWSNLPVGAHPLYIVADHLGNVFTSNRNNTVSKINSSGTATAIAVGPAYTTYYPGNQASPIALDQNGNLYVGIRNGASSKIVKIAAGGTTTADFANLASDPEWIAVDVTRNSLYVARKAAKRISKVDLTNSNAGTNTIAEWAILTNDPIQIAVDATTGNVYTLNQTSGNDNVSKVTSTGTVTNNFASLSGTSSVGMFAGTNGSVYVLDDIDKTITRVKPDGTTEQIVSSGDGLNSVSLQKAGMVFDNTATFYLTTSEGKVARVQVRPTVNTVTIASDNADNTKAKLGNKVTVNFTTSEAVNTPTATIAGTSATVTNLSGNTSWKAEVTLGTSNTTGTATFLISNIVSSSTGVAAIDVSATTNGSSVVIDTITPTLSTLTIVSNNANTAKAKVGDLITLNFTSSEVINTPTVTIGSATATVTNLSGSTSWKAELTMLAGNTQAQGQVVFSVAISDPTGNTRTVTTTTNGSRVVYDTIRPTLNPVAIASNGSSASIAGPADSVTITFTTSEALSLTPTVSVSSGGQVIQNPVQVRRPSGNNWTAGFYLDQANDLSGAITFSITNVRDTTGNVANTVTTTTNGSSVTFVKSKPTLTSVTIASNNATNTRRATTGNIVTLNFTASEAINTPVVKLTTLQRTVTATNASGDKLNWQVAYTTVVGDPEDSVTISIVPTSVFGIAGDEVRTTTNGTYVLFDKTKPTLSSVAIVSNNPLNTARATTGNLVTLSFTTSERLSQKPNISIAGQVIPAGSVTNISGNNWKGEYTLAGTETEDTIRFYVSYVDSAGIRGDTVRITNNNSRVIYDKTKPLLTSVAIVSNNTTNTAKATTGDTVTVNFTTNEALSQKPSVSIAGQVIAASSVTNISGNNWKGVYKLVGTEAEDTVRFFISFIDSVGIKGDTVRATTNNSRVIFDKTKPTLSSVAIISNNVVNTARATTGDSITVSFTSSEALSRKPSVSIAGQLIADSCVTKISGNNWKGVYKLVGTETEDTVRFFISYVDSAGIKGDTVRITNNNSRVIFDKTKPTLSSVAIISNNAANTARAITGDSVTLSFTASELLSQKPSVSIAGQVIPASSVTNVSGNNWKGVYRFAGTEPEDTVRFYVSYIDSSGNRGDTVRTTNNSSIVIFDKTAPALTTVGILSNNINSNSHAAIGDTITLNFTAAETIVSPSVLIAGQAVSSTNVSGNNWKATYKTQSGDTEGTVSFQIAYKDVIGNVDTVRNTTTNNTRVRFDKTAPTLTSVTIASNASDPAIAIINSVVTLSFVANEGVLTPTATIAGNTVTPTLVSGNSWTASYTIKATDTEGQIPFTINYKDSAGIAGVAVTTTTNNSKVVLDKSALVLSMVSIASNNTTDTSHATTGDIITIKFKASREINIPTVLLAGNSVTATNTSGDKINWQASYTSRVTDTEGVTSIKIDFTDLAGNVGLTANGTLDNTRVIFDKTPPTLSSIGILSSNANTAKAKVGDTIILNIVSGEGIMAPVVTIAGSGASVTYISGNNWRASYIIQSTVAEGNIPFSIAYKDSAGLSGTAVTATTNNSAVVLDKTIPILNSVSIISNNANTVRAKVGDTVTLSFTANEGILTPVVTISGQTANVTQISGNNWKASYVMRSTDAEGSIPFNIAFKDAASNDGIAVTSVTDNSSVLFDRTLPQLTSVSIVSNSNISTNRAAIGDIITLSFTSNEVLLTPVVTISGQTASVTLVSGNNWSATYTMRATDVEGSIAFTIAFRDATSNEGNIVSATTNNSSVIFDRTGPQLTTVSIASNNSVFKGNAIAGDQVTVSFQANETIDPPVVTIAGKNATVTNTSGDKINWVASYTMVAADAEGNIPFTIALKDVLSNVGTTVTATTDNSKVIFDKTNPVLTSVNISSNNPVTGRARIGNQITVSFVASEMIQPPVVTIAGRAATVTGSGRNWSAVYSMVNADTEGNISFAIAFRDSSGIAGTTVTAVTDVSNVIFDKTAPVLNSISFSSNNADRERAQPGDIVTVNFTSNETLLTPSVSIVGRTVDATNVSGNNWTASYIMTSRDVADVQSYMIAYNDLAGNKGITRSASSTVTSICPTSFPYTWNNNQYADTGRYSVMLINSEGADSTTALILRFHPVPAIPVIIRSAASFCTGDSILLESSAVLNNQWVLNGNDVIGATGKFLSTKELGLNTYTVRVTNNLSCYSVSAPVTTQYLNTVGTKLSLNDTMVCKAIVVPVTVNSVETVSSYSWSSRNTGFTASTQTVNLVNQDRYTATVVLNNGCVVTDTINFRTTADTAIKARMVMSKQAFVNQQIKAVNLTSPTPQTQVWGIPAGAGVVSNTPNELVIRFANPGNYTLYLNNTSYNICRSSDTANIVITTNDSANVLSTNTTIIRNLTIGPNPTTGRFRINVELNRPGKTSVRIYDMNGAPVFQNIYQEPIAKFSKDIDISSQPSQRTYVLIVQSDGGYEVRAIIKN